MKIKGSKGEIGSTQKRKITCWAFVFEKRHLLMQFYGLLLFTYILDFD